MAMNPGGQSSARTTGSTSASSSTPSASREFSRSYGGGQRMQPTNDLLAYCQTYAREKPEMAALICFGVGFVLGWKLKPW